MTAPAAPQHVLVVGGGGRENALAWALARSAGVQQVWVAPGNGGTAELEGCIQLAISEGDQDALLKTCQDETIDLVVVGPEAPLAAGLGDRLRQAGFAVFGPGADGAQLEASKQWAKALMVEAGIPTAGYWKANSRDEALRALDAQGAARQVEARQHGLGAQARRELLDWAWPGPGVVRVHAQPRHLGQRRQFAHAADRLVE